MRTFSLFVSALAFANLAQAAPLVDNQFAQLDAELDAFAEAMLAPNVNDSKKLIEDLTKKGGIIQLIRKGSNKTEDYTVKRSRQVRNDDEDVAAGHDKYYNEWYDATETKSTYDFSAINKDFVAMKKAKKFYAGGLETQDIRDFDAWANAVEELIPDLEAENKKVGAGNIDNFAEPVVAMKEKVTSMTNCL